MRTDANQAATTAAVICSLEHSQPIEVFGSTVFPMFSPTDADDAPTLFLYEAAPLAGPPPHRHRAQDETFLTIDAGFEFLVDGRWEAVPPHTMVHVPAGVTHTFRNVSARPARSWVMVRPGDFIEFFRALEAIGRDAAERNAPPDMTRVAQVYNRFDVEPVA